jgi:hypothetical protein
MGLSAGFLFFRWIDQSLHLSTYDAAKASLELRGTGRQGVNQQRIAHPILCENSS